ncbi:MAG: hypothetical protein IJX36_06580, partial [Thermoguttaceae bacterium]|nr:hypothetical protein [Thermoguttaceae bacterium]
MSANGAVFAQNYPFRAAGGRRVWNVPPTGIPSRVEPSETPRTRNRTATAVDVAPPNRVEAGIPSRLEGAETDAPRRPDVRETAPQDAGWAVSGA